MKRDNLCVFCSSSDQIDNLYAETAYELGRLCAQHNIRIVNGAGNTGLMARCADGCLENGGKVTGIIPKYMVDNGWMYNGLTESIYTSTMAERKQMMRDMTDGTIVLPGGCGTMEEFFETLTLRQQGLYEHPIILLNVSGFFNQIEDWLNKAIETHFMRESNRILWSTAETPIEALNLFQTLPETHGLI